MTDYIILTAKEAEVLRLQLQGMTQADIARALETSRQNIGNIVRSLREKGFTS